MKRLIYILVFVVAWVAYERFLVPDLPTSSAQPISAQSSPRTEQWRAGHTRPNLLTKTGLVTNKFAIVADLGFPRVAVGVFFGRLLHDKFSRKGSVYYLT